MKLTGLLTTALADPALATAADLARRGGPLAEQVDVTAPASARPFLVAAIAADDAGAGRPALVVTATSREAEDLASALVGLIPADEVAVYPAWETLPHERLSPRSDTVGRRLGVLRRLAHPDDADPLARPAPGRRRAGPVDVAAAAQGPRRSGTSGIAPGLDG